MRRSATRSALSIILLSAALLSGCQSNETIHAPAPEWINDPGDGAVGSAVTHIKGRHAQEELAITRARERLAARYGVEISSVHTIKERVANEKAYVTSEKQIEQLLKRREVNAHVRQTWYDPARDVVWAWVYPVSD